MIDVRDENERECKALRAVLLQMMVELEDSISQSAGDELLEPVRTEDQRLLEFLKDQLSVYNVSID